MSKIQKISKGLTTLRNIRPPKGPAFMHAILDLAMWCVKTTTKISIPLGVCSVLAINYGEDLATESVEDYAKNHDIPEEMYENLNHKKVRIYHNNIVAWLHKAGKPSAVVFNMVSDDEDASVMGKTIGYGFGAVLYPFFLLESTLDSYTNNPIGAYAIPGFDKGDTCYVRPGAEITGKRLVAAFTGLPKKKLEHLELPESERVRQGVIIKSIILGHELDHCDSNTFLSSAEQSGLKSKTNGSESHADIHTMESALDAFPDSIDEVKLFYYSRTFIGVSEKAGRNIGHSTSLITDAHFNSRAMPTRDEAYYAYAHLQELLDVDMMDYDEDTDGRPYDEALYEALERIIANDDRAYTSPLVKRAAELYIEGHDYIFSYDQRMTSQENLSIN